MPWRRRGQLKKESAAHMRGLGVLLELVGWGRAVPPGAHFHTPRPRCACSSVERPHLRGLLEQIHRTAVLLVLPKVPLVVVC